MELLWRSRRRKTLIDWPQAVDDRLEILVRSATAGGENVSRAQLLAALVAGADASPERLADLVRAYRRTEADTFTANHARDDLPPARHPGPRRTCE